VIDDTGAARHHAAPQALAIAKTKGLDLVEIRRRPSRRSAGSDFAACASGAEAGARGTKAQKVIEVREISSPEGRRARLLFKKKHIERFLEDGDKVKATIFFRGQNGAPGNRTAHSRLLVDELADVAIAETMPRLAGNQMHTILSRIRKAAAEQTRVAPRRAERRNLMGKVKKIKLKTHRGAAKRFKRTKNGKFLRGKAFKQHILSSKTTKRKRALRGTTTVADVDARKLARMLPYA
jgi:large subunit ribosomal protein L35